MTVGQQLHQSLNNLEAEKANLENFALQTQNDQAKQTFNNCANQLEQVVQDLKSRTNAIENEEPQYKVRQNQQTQQTQQQQQQ